MSSCVKSMTESPDSCDVDWDMDIDERSDDGRPTFFSFFFFNSSKKASISSAGTAGRRVLDAVRECIDGCGETF